MYTPLLPFWAAIALGCFTALLGALWIYFSIGLARFEVTKKEVCLEVIPVGVFIGACVFGFLCLPSVA